VAGRCGGGYTERKWSFRRGKRHPRFVIPAEDTLRKIRHSGEENATIDSSFRRRKRHPRFVIPAEAGIQ
jgi:hypothetical protein